MTFGGVHPIAGSWLASPATAYDHELIAAGLSLVAGPVDRDLLKQGFGPDTRTARALGWDIARRRVSRTSRCRGCCVWHAPVIDTENARQDKIAEGRY